MAAVLIYSVCVIYKLERNGLLSRSVFHNWRALAFVRTRTQSDSNRTEPYLSSCGVIWWIGKAMSHDCLNSIWQNLRWRQKRNGILSESLPAGVNFFSRVSARAHTSLFLLTAYHFKRFVYFLLGIVKNFVEKWNLIKNEIHVRSDMTDARPRDKNSVWPTPTPTTRLWNEMKCLF